LAVKAVTVPRLKPQVYPEGAPLHASETWPVKFLTKFIVIGGT